MSVYVRYRNCGGCAHFRRETVTFPHLEVEGIEKAPETYEGCGLWATGFALYEDTDCPDYETPEDMERRLQREARERERAERERKARKRKV